MAIKNLEASRPRKKASGTTKKSQKTQPKNGTKTQPKAQPKLQTVLKETQVGIAEGHQKAPKKKKRTLGLLSDADARPFQLDL